MPIYHLMTMSLNGLGFYELERILQEFLWGKNEEGENRKALVAWFDTALNKAEGGIGFDNLHHTSLALKMRWCGRILMEEDTPWVLLAKVGITWSLNSGFRRRYGDSSLELKLFCWMRIFILWDLLFFVISLGVLTKPKIT